MFGAEAIDKQVVNDRAALGRESGVLSLTVNELRGVVRADAIDEGYRVSAANLYLAHVRNVEEARARARPGVLFARAGGVLHGHVPTAKLDHAPAESAVRRVERRLLELGFSHTVLRRASANVLRK